LPEQQSAACVKQPQAKGVDNDCWLIATPALQEQTTTGPLNECLLRVGASNDRNAHSYNVQTSPEQHSTELELWAAQGLRGTPKRAGPGP
jgi:hypothetical protein